MNDSYLARVKDIYGGPKNEKLHLLLLRDTFKTTLTCVWVNWKRSDLKVQEPNLCVESA